MEKSSAKLPIPDEQELLFSTKSIRLGFMRKVFWVFACQLLVTTGCVTLTTFNSRINGWLRSRDNNGAVLLISLPLIFAILILIALTSSRRLSRSFPLNLILLGLLTLCTAIPLAAASALSQTNHVIYAGGITLFVSLITAVFSLQSRVYTSCGVGLGLTIFGTVFITLILYLVVPETETRVMLVGSGGALLISLYLVVFVQVTMMRTECCACWFRSSPEEYVLAAAKVYLVFGVIFAVMLLLMAIVASEGKACDGGGGGGCVIVPCNDSSCGTSDRKKKEEEDLSPVC